MKPLAFIVCILSAALCGAANDPALLKQPGPRPVTFLRGNEHGNCNCTADPRQICPCGPGRCTCRECLCVASCGSRKEPVRGLLRAPAFGRRCSLFAPLANAARRWAARRPYQRRRLGLSSCKHAALHQRRESAEHEEASRRIAVQGRGGEQHERSPMLGSLHLV